MLDLALKIKVNQIQITNKKKKIIMRMKMNKVTRIKIKQEIQKNMS